MAPEICPNCGAAVPRRARACPECGADEFTGWSDDAGTGHLDLPSADFDYSAFTRREFGTPSPKPDTLSWFWWFVAVVVLAAMVCLWLL